MKKATQDKEFEEIATKAQEKRQEIINVQEVLYRNADEQREKEFEIE